MPLSKIFSKIFSDSGRRNLVIRSRRAKGGEPMLFLGPKIRKFLGKQKRKARREV